MHVSQEDSGANIKSNASLKKPYLLQHGILVCVELFPPLCIYFLASLLIALQTIVKLCRENS